MLTSVVWVQGKADERRQTHEAARFLVGYLLGLPIEGTVPDDKITAVREKH